MGILRKACVAELVFAISFVVDFSNNVLAIDDRLIFSGIRRKRLSRSVGLRGYLHEGNLDIPKNN
jgi:hypothetical protein